MEVKTFGLESEEVAVERSFEWKAVDFGGYNTGL
jgi:hypothetical protein